MNSYAHTYHQVSCGAQTKRESVRSLHVPLPVVLAGEALGHQKIHPNPTKCTQMIDECLGTEWWERVEDLHRAFEPWDQKTMTKEQVQEIDDATIFGTV